MKRTNMFFTARVIFMLCVFYISLNAQNWPMINCSKERTSWAESETCLYPPLKKTSDFTLDNDAIADGISFYDKKLFVIIENDSTEITAFDSETGNELWRFRVPEASHGVNLSPAANDSLVLCGGQGGLGLYALDPLTGSIKWFKNIGDLYSKNPIIDNNRVFIVADSLYCLNIQDGATVWSFPFEMPVSPAVDEEKVYLCGEGQLTAFNKSNGEVVWQIDNSQLRYTSVAVDENHVYTCNHDTIVALYKDSGLNKWSFPIPDGRIPNVATNAIAVSDSFLCISIWEDSEEKGRLYTLEKMTGHHAWYFVFDATGVISPAIANNIVYAINWKTYSVWGFDLKTGQRVFYDNSEQYIGQPIVADHRLYVCAYGKVVAFENMNSGVRSNETESVESFVLSPNCPNPFNQSTRFQFDLMQSRYLDIAVYNLLGECVKILSSKEYTAGAHVLIWDGTDDDNKTVPSGIYVLKLSTTEFTQSIKMVLLK